MEFNENISDVFTEILLDDNYEEEDENNFFAKVKKDRWEICIISSEGKILRRRTYYSFKEVNKDYPQISTNSVLTKLANGFTKKVKPSTIVKYGRLLIRKIQPEDDIE